MKITDILILTQNRLASLVVQRDEAWAIGNFDAVNALDPQIADTTEAVAQLQTLIPAPE